MTNLSSLSKILFLLVGVIVFSFVKVIYILVAGSPGVWLSLIDTCVIVGGIAGSLYYVAHLKAVFTRAAEVCNRAAKGDLEARILELPEPGPVGAIQKGINNTLDVADAFVREAAGSASYAAKGKYFRKILLKGLPGSFLNAAQTLNASTEITEQKVKEFGTFAQNFEDNVVSVIDQVALAAEDMRGGAEAMSRNATSTSEQIASASVATQQAYSNVQTVSAAAEELSSSVSEISRQVLRSSAMARDAVTQADATNNTVQGLADAAERVGNVVTMISDIAAQTNLLALNATIEAARAGESGRGFAVVAGEVKSLAAQTASATKEIAEQIAGIQGVTGDAVAMIRSIGDAIRAIDEIATMIASATEEQAAATQEIARNVQEASRGTSDVSERIETVNGAAVETGETANNVLGSASLLSTQAIQLKADVVAFMARAKAA
ncbi:MAG: methyl-accepting chemotaxis protein [Parvibaculaceae bacterium]